MNQSEIVELVTALLDLSHIPPNNETLPTDNNIEPERMGNIHTPLDEENSPTDVSDRQMVLTVLDNITTQYNSTINQYHTNIQNAMSILQNIDTQRHSGVNRSENITQNQSPFQSPFQSHIRAPSSTNRARENTIFYTTFIPENLQNVIIQPSEEEINRSVENVRYTQTNIIDDNRCPITLEPFMIGDNVSRIRHCGHTFSIASLQNWFRGSVRCPVCRYDIREYQPTSHINPELNDNIEESQQTENSEENIDEDELLDNRLRTLTSEVTNIISDYFTNENPDVYNAPQVSVEIHTQMTDVDSDNDTDSDSDSYSDIQPNYSVD